MEIALFSLVGAIVLNALVAFIAERVRKYRNFMALQIEVNEAILLANTYLNDRIWCPLYRIPNVALETSGIELLKSSALVAKDLEAFIHYSNQVAQINRGLDYMNEHRVRVLSTGTGDLSADSLANAEKLRLSEKCKELRDTYGAALLKAINKRLQTFWIGRVGALFSGR